MSKPLRFRGKLFRALNPVYARQPLSGEGAARFGGGFNRKGVAALYCSLSPLTALREANQAGALQPTMLISYEADIEGVFDSRDAEALAKAGLDAAALASSTWRDEMKKGEARTQVFARHLIKSGHNGLLVRSFAKGATEEDLNLVLWNWDAKNLELIDDEGRLPRSLA